MKNLIQIHSRTEGTSSAAILLLSLSCCKDKDCREGGCRVRGHTLRTMSFVNSDEVVISATSHLTTTQNRPTVKNNKTTKPSTGGNPLPSAYKQEIQQILVRTRLTTALIPTCNTLLLLSDNTREYNEYSRNRCYVFASRFKSHAYIIPQKSQRRKVIHL